MFPENNPQQKLENTFRHLNRITGKHWTYSVIVHANCVHQWHVYTAVSAQLATVYEMNISL